jgi:hypothetical protein
VPGNGKGSSSPQASEALDKANIETQLRKHGFTDPKAIQYLVDEVLGKSTPVEQQQALRYYLKIKPDELAAKERAYAKRQTDKDTAAGIVPSNTGR